MRITEKMNEDFVVETFCAQELLQSAIVWIGAKVPIEKVYYREQLETWALKNGWTKKKGEKSGENKNGN